VFELGSLPISGMSSVHKERAGTREKRKKLISK
jgi:hypothetical protein